MPYALTVAKANAALGHENVQALSADAGLLEQLSQPGAFLEVAQSLLELDGRDLEYLGAIPKVLQETMRAAVAGAVSEAKPVHVQYSPGYDFEVRVWDFGDAVGIHLSGPYPPDFPRDRYLASKT